MIKIYLKYIKQGLITIEDVPERWRAAVEEALKEEE